MLRQFLKYAVVGAVGTAAHYAVLVTLVQYGGLSPSFATTIGFCVGAVINYALNIRFVFASTHRHRDALPKFFALATAGALVNYLIVALLTRQLAVHYLIAQVVATSVVLVCNYLANRAWTFAKKPA